MLGKGTCPVEAKLLIYCCRCIVVHGGEPYTCHIVEHVLVQWHIYPTIVASTEVHVVGYVIVSKQQFVPYNACRYACIFRRGYSGSGMHHIVASGTHVALCHVYNVPRSLIEMSSITFNIIYKSLI